MVFVVALRKLKLKNKTQHAYTDIHTLILHDFNNKSLSQLKVPLNAQAASGNAQMVNVSILNSFVITLLTVLTDLMKMKSFAEVSNRMPLTLINLWKSFKQFVSNFEILSFLGKIFYRKFIFLKSLIVKKTNFHAATTASSLRRFAMETETAQTTGMNSTADPISRPKSQRQAHL